jgi:hypothetical protein
MNTFAFGANPLRWVDPFGMAGIATWNDFQAANAGKFQGIPGRPATPTSPAVPPVSPQAEAAAGWKVYQQNNRSCLEPAIGRLDDTRAASTMGHQVLNNNPWSPAINDAWMQGGIDRRTPFYMASPDTPANRANPPGSPYGPTTIYNRELNQLTTAGYRPNSAGTYMVPP